MAVQIGKKSVWRHSSGELKAKGTVYVCSRGRVDIRDCGRSGGVCLGDVRMPLSTEESSTSYIRSDPAKFRY